MLNVAYVHLVAGRDHEDREKFDGELYAPLGPQMSILQAVERVG